MSDIKSNAFFKNSISKCLSEHMSEGNIFSWKWNKHQTLKVTSSNLSPNSLLTSGMCPNQCFLYVSQKQKLSKQPLLKALEAQSNNNIIWIGLQHTFFACHGLCWFAASQWFPHYYACSNWNSASLWSGKMCQTSWKKQQNYNSYTQKFIEMVTSFDFAHGPWSAQSCHWHLGHEGQSDQDTSQAVPNWKVLPLASPAKSKCAGSCAHLQARSCKYLSKSPLKFVVKGNRTLP